MPKDAPTADRIRRNKAALNEAGVRAQIIEARPRERRAARGGARPRVRGLRSGPARRRWYIP